MPNPGAYYTWASTATQANAGADVVAPMKVTGVNSGSGAGFITLTNASTNATFTVANAGVYEITFQVNAYNSGSDASVHAWALKNGTNIDRSSASTTVANNHYVYLSTTFTTQLAANQYLTFAWLSNSSTVELRALGAVASKQASTPSFSVSIKQLSSSWRPANIWFVSKDSTSGRYPVGGDGSYENPYSTIQQAILAADAIGASAGTQTILVYPGTYVETLSITKGYVTIQGFAPSQFANGAVTIIASPDTSHTINITNPAYGTVHLNQTAFSNLTLAPSTTTDPTIPTVRDVSTQPHGLIFNQCQVLGRTCAIDNLSAGSDGRLYLNDCELAQTVTAASPLPLVRHRLGAAILYKCNFTNLSNSPCLEVSLSGVVWSAALCSFISTTAEAEAAPIVLLSSNIVYPMQFGLCQFIYNSSTPKTSALSTGILLSGVTSQQLVVTGSYFTLLGMPQDADAIHVDGSAVHQVWSRENYAFNIISGGVSAPAAHYINAPVALMLPLQAFV